MKNYLKTANIVFCSAILFFTSCSKDNNNPSPGGANSRVVKYEITGNFTGKLSIIYNDNVSGNTVENNVTPPFTKERTYPASVTAIGIGGHGTAPGAAGQTVTVKIYSGGNVVKTTTATAGPLGEITLPSLAHLF